MEHANNKVVVMDNQVIIFQRRFIHESPAARRRSRAVRVALLNKDDVRAARDYRVQTPRTLTRCVRIAVPDAWKSTTDDRLVEV